MANLRVSVTAMVPCWKSSETLSRALTSIASQSALPMQTVLVDDGNSGDEWERLSQIATQYPELKPEWIRLDKNVGAASARNAGWAIARERYIAFLDADDAWHPRKLELQTALMESHPELELSGHDVSVLKPGEVLPELPQLTRRRDTPVYVWTFIVNPFATPTWMIRRGSRMRFREGMRHAEDHLFLMELAARGGKMGGLNQSLTALFKPPLSRSGLSSQLWPMERGELLAYRHLLEEKLLGRTAWMSLSALSLVKFLRRLAVVLLLR